MDQIGNYSVILRQSLQSLDIGILRAVSLEVALVSRSRDIPKIPQMKLE